MQTQTLMDGNAFYRTEFYPTNFVSGLSGRQETRQLTTVLRDAQDCWQTAGEEMLEYYGLRQGKNLSVGPTMDELTASDEADRG